MSYTEVECALVKKDGQIIGLTLVAPPKTQSEMFCDNMMGQLVDGHGHIKFTHRKVTFTSSDLGDVSFLIEDDDAGVLQSILGDNKKTNISILDFPRQGFKIAIDGIEEEERTNLIRV